MFHLLEKSVIEYHSRTLVSFVEWVMHHFGILTWILHQDEKFSLLYTIKTFYTFIEKESVGKTGFNVADLLDICELMTTYKIRLPVHELAHVKKGIHLSSLHGAKGLEFEKVIIKNLTENEWEKKRPFSNSFSYPDNLNRKDSFTEFLAADLDHDDQDRRRLLYVGMTRAKQELILTYAAAKDDGKGLTPSVYLTEITSDNPNITVTKSVTNEEMLSEYLVAFMSGEQKAELNLDNAVLRERVQNFVMNVSALNTYLECPVRFYYEKLLVIPSSEAAPLLFGSALHDALQLFFIKRFTDQDTSKGKDYLVDIFTWFMQKKSHRFTIKEFDNLNTYGRKILAQFYDHASAKWTEEIKYEIEYKIKDVHITGVPAKGFIDRIDRVGNDLFVFDYKSGRAESISEKLKRPSDTDPVGGHYWRQMVFYDLLMKNDPRLNKGMSTGFMQGLEPKKDGTFVDKNIMISDDDRALVTEQIVTTYHKIQNMEFEIGCGECKWCRMHDLNPPMERVDESEQD
ncbi:MAG: PD-(D/E)XK nuclease family protein, partial [Saprospiraceae bacterium]